MYAEAHYYVGSLYYAYTSKKDGKALELLNKLVERKTSSAWAYYWRGRFLELFWFNTPGISLNPKKTLSTWDKALDDYKQAMRLSAEPEVKEIILKRASSLLDSRNTYVEIRAGADAAWKAENRKGLQEIIGLIPTIVQTVVQSQSNPSKTQTSPPVQQTPQPNTSGGQTSSTNASSTNSSTNTNNSSQNTSTTGGNTTPKRSWASIAQVPPPSESCSKSSYLPARTLLGIVAGYSLPSNPDSCKRSACHCRQFSERRC
jgi:hypothetical protein